MEHIQRLERPFPWRAAALAAAAVALAELTALLALAGLRLFHVHHPTRTPAERTRPVAATGHGSTGHVHALRPRSRTSVLVLNGNGIAHAAGNEASQLLAHGYRHALPTDAPRTYASSVVLFRPGWEREARRLARDAEIRAVTPLDVRLPSADATYQLVVILGTN
ncbi:MAG: LytR C-terminal domain-containing protein [Gaiellaceae bacterium]